MSLAQRFERRLESLVGTAFARVFNGQVEPVEIGAALQREATDKRNVMGNGEVLAPNRYRVTLSPSDHERLAPWEAQLTESLAELVQEHVDESHWNTIGDIEVYLARDDALHTGVFGVASRMESNAPPRQRPYDSLSLPAMPATPLADIGQPYVTAKPSEFVPGFASENLPPAAPPPFYNQQPPPPTYAAPPPGMPPRIRGSLMVDGTNQVFELRPGANVVGRGNDANLQLLDQGVSRKHIDIQFDGYAATVFDLGSTNGTNVNGHEITRQILRHGDVIRLGHSRLVYQQGPA
jgi:hypothetical protein